MRFIELHLYQGNDKRPDKPILVNTSRIECMEVHAITGTRIQFHLGEPSLYVKESMTKILLHINETKLRRI